MDILILAKAGGSRLVYTFDLIFRDLLGLDYRLVQEFAEFVAFRGPKLIYHHEINEQSKQLQIPASPLLYETDVRPQMLQMSRISGVPVFFSQREAGSFLPFDLPAAVFYLVSRYEEYLPFTPDAHGRFPAAAGLAFQENFLHLPLVNLWIRQLGERLLARFPQLPVKFSVYRCLATYDVDLAWAYRYQRWWRQLGGLGRSILSGRGSSFQERLAVWTGGQEDPFFTFDYLDNLDQKYGLSPVYFFLLSSGGRFDNNIDYAVPAFQDLIRSVASRHRCGIHPSYQSNRSGQVLQTEIDRLQRITQKPVTSSRQHFLKLHLPTTYRRLLAAGIRADYSMGYADQLGFRASIATPFPWYDLLNETATGLMIHPFQVMDVTLKDYLKLSPAEAVEKVAALIADTRRAGGCFTTLWHNSSFADSFGWRGWNTAYEDILERMVV